MTLELQFLEHQKKQCVDLHEEMRRIEYVLQSKAARENFKSLLLLEATLLMGGDGRRGGRGWSLVGQCVVAHIESNECWSCIRAHAHTTRTLACTRCMRGIRREGHSKHCGSAGSTRAAAVAAAAALRRARGSCTTCAAPALLPPPPATDAGPAQALAVVPAGLCRRTGGRRLLQLLRRLRRQGGEGFKRQS
jgi:hypothetical protein